MAKHEWPDLPKVMSKRGAIFLYDIVILALLSALATLYLKDVGKVQSAFPDALQGLPLYTIWFGSLGGIVISLKGVYDHAVDWKSDWVMWHYGRPFSGAVVGGITYVLLRAVSAQSSTSSSSILSAPVVETAAFVLGTQEKRFFNFAFSVGRLVLSVPDEAPSGLRISLVAPDAAAPSAAFLIQGSGFHRDASVLFGSAVVTGSQVSGDGTAVAGVVPPGSGPVDVEVRNPDGSAFVKAKGFTIK